MIFSSIFKILLRIIFLLPLDNGIGYHDLGREASSIEVYLAEIATINPKSRVLVQLHGIFMIMAWIGATSAGVVLARYFKYTWVDKTLWGKERWFSVSCFNFIL